MKRTRHFTVLMFLLLAGCSWLGLGEAKSSVRTLRVVAFPAANGQMATAVDVVFVYRLDAALPKSAPEWFAQKRALIGAAPKALEVVSCEVPPGQVIERLALPERHGRALQVIAYANHVEAAGQRAVNLTPLRKAVLWVDALTTGAVEEGQPMAPSGGE